MPITLEGLADLLDDFLEADSRLNEEPMTPVLQTLEQQMIQNFQANITSGGSRFEAVAQLPAQHPATAAIRRYYGHASKPRLNRGGELARSITGLGQGDQSVEVGTRRPGAFVLHEGGTTLDRRGRRVRVPAHPFLVHLGDDLDAYDRTIARYFIDEPFGAV